MPDWSKLPTPRKLQQIIKRFTPEQVKYIEAHIRELCAQNRRSYFKVINGGRHTKHHR